MMNSICFTSYVLFLIVSMAIAFIPVNNMRYSFNKLSLSMEQKGIVTMYTKNTCPFCKEAKKLLTEKYELEITEVDVMGAKQEDILQQMRQFSGGRNTVPQIFFNSEYLGGNDDVQGLESEGLLAEKVEKVKSTEVTMMMDHWYHPWY